MKSKTLSHGVKEERNISHKIKRMKDSWIGHILRNNRLLKHVIEENERRDGRQGRRFKQLLGNLKEERKY